MACFNFPSSWAEKYFLVAIFSVGHFLVPISWIQKYYFWFINRAITQKGFGAAKIG
jgi:hypothetical protein